MEIGAGKYLWEDEQSQSVEMKQFRNFVQHNYLPFLSHTQFIEAGVKKSKLVSATGREERLQSLLAIIQNNTVRTFVKDATKNTTRKKEGAKDHTPKVRCPDACHNLFQCKLCFEYLTLVAIL